MVPWPHGSLFWIPFTWIHFYLNILHFFSLCRQEYPKKSAKLSEILLTVPKKCQEREGFLIKGMQIEKLEKLEAFTYIWISWQDELRKLCFQILHLIKSSFKKVYKHILKSLHSQKVLGDNVKSVSKEESIGDNVDDRNRMWCEWRKYSVQASGEILCYK